MISAPRRAGGAAVPMLGRYFRWNHAVVSISDQPALSLTLIVGNLHVGRSLLKVVFDDDDGARSTSQVKNAGGRTVKGPEPPARRGDPADKERARRPPLRSLKGRRTKTV
jgi:hypothetical protein